MFSYQSTLSLYVELVVCLKAVKVFTLDQVNHFILCQINAIVEVTTPEQVIMVPHLTTLRTTMHSTHT